MKKTLLVVSACLLFGSPGLRAGADVRASKDDAFKRNATVYQVPWRCPAALQIGCGSHAKPILLELEQDPGVSEAWLNRQGTAVAVVLKADAKGKARRDAGKDLIKGRAAEPSGKGRAKKPAGFESGEGVCPGAQVG